MPAIHNTNGATRSKPNRLSPRALLFVFRLGRSVFIPVTVNYIQQVKKTGWWMPLSTNQHLVYRVTDLWSLP